MSGFAVPPELAARGREDLRLGDWLDRLPGLVRTLLDEWELRVDGGTGHGFCSVVVPVRTAAGVRAALKVTWDADEESALEHLALAHWAGRGVVGLVRADPARRALLLERLRTTDLHAATELEACEVVGRAYRRLHEVVAASRFTRLSEVAARWGSQLDDLPPGDALPRRLVVRARAALGDFATDPGTDGRLVHFDLHHGNVLADDAGRWRVIDPKPLSGDPHAELSPMLLNRFTELAPDVRAGLRHRFDTLLDVAELDEDRAREWVIARVVVNAGWSVALAAARHRRLTAAEQEWVTRCVTVAKAVD